MHSTDSCFTRAPACTGSRLRLIAVHMRSFHFHPHPYSTVTDPSPFSVQVELANWWEERYRLAEENIPVFLRPNGFSDLPALVLAVGKAINYRTVVCKQRLGPVHDVLVCGTRRTHKFDVS